MPEEAPGRGHGHPHGDVPAADGDWRAELRRRGYRLTPQRELILAAINELGHATPDEVLGHVQARASSVNASTVYRTLEVLEGLGLVRHAHLSDRAPTYHAVGGHEHFHLVCRNCQRVTSVETAAASELTERLAADHGFVADIGHLAVFGHCQDCAVDPEPHGHERPPQPPQQESDLA